MSPPRWNAHSLDARSSEPNHKHHISASVNCSTAVLILYEAAAMMKKTTKYNIDLVCALGILLGSASLALIAKASGCAPCTNCTDYDACEFLVESNSTTSCTLIFIADGNRFDNFDREVGPSKCTSTDPVPCFVYTLGEDALYLGRHWDRRPMYKQCPVRTRTFTGVILMSILGLLFSSLYWKHCKKVKLARDRAAYKRKLAAQIEEERRRCAATTVMVASAPRLDEIGLKDISSDSESDLEVAHAEPESAMNRGRSDYDVDGSDLSNEAVVEEFTIDI